MVDEIGSVSSLYVASTRDVVPFQTEAQSRKRAAVENTKQASAGQLDRPGFSASIAQIRASAEQRAETAVQLRQFQTNVRAADELLAEIKEQLTHIVKQYPPFALDDPQRLAYLNAIAGLRKQLDALAFPPEREANKEASTVGSGQAAPLLSDIPVKGDLSIPELAPRSAGDEEVASALGAVKNAQARVQELQGSMWQDVVNFVGTPNLGQSADDQVQAQVGEVRGYVASNTSRGIGLSLNTILSIGI